MTHHHIYIGGISFIPQASKLDVASKASGTKETGHYMSCFKIGLRYIVTLAYL